MIRNRSNNPPIKQLNILTKIKLKKKKNKKY